MARHKNERWNLPEGTANAEGGTSHSWNSIHTALLMDIRDELQALNRILNCSNFLAIPRHLRRIARQTDRKRRKPGRAK